MRSDKYTDSGIPVLRGNNISGDRSLTGDLVYVSEETADDLRSSNLKAGDLFFPHRGAIGAVGLVPEEPVDQRWMMSTSLMKLTCNEALVLPAFVYYFFRSPQGRAALLRYSSNVGTPGIVQPLTSLKSIRFAVPALGTQRRIVAILSTYDDLIENTRRRMALLEEMAQGIYREWFVRFRHPKHEASAPNNPEPRLPRSWSLLPAAEALSINPRLAIKRDESRPFVPMASISEHDMHIFPIERRVGSSGPRFENGDTLFARITPCLENGKTAFVQGLADCVVASGSTELIVLRSKRLSPEYVYLLARSEPFRAHAIASMSGATGRQRVREDCFSSYDIAVPDGATLAAFTACTRPMFELSHSLFKANEALRKSRDVLLPRLISGSLDVAGLNIAIPEKAK